MKLYCPTNSILSLLIFSTLLIANQAFAQTPRSLDKIILVDGSELKGLIISKEKVLLLELEDGQELEIPLDQIESIENKDPHKLYFSNGAIIRTKGWFHSGNIAFGGAGSSSNEGGTSLSIELINGYQLNSKVGIGLGFGLHLHSFLSQGAGDFAFNYTDDQYSILPVFMKLRLSPWEKKIAPYFGINAGYGIGADIFDYWGGNEGKMKGGLMGGASFGLRIATKKKMGFIFHLNYKMQQASGERNDLNGFYRVTDITFHRILIGIGWSF